uniref:FEZ family zinc finger 2 n=1 Tax=Aquila chrysaetos chrysaetos TaxID=223781 RepID=A0A663F9F0_AQUCH
MASSGSLETVMPSSCPRHDGRAAAANPSKTLAFSIERIMAKTSEPKPAFEQRHGGPGPEPEPGKKPLSLCSPLPCVIPIPPLGYEVPSKTLLNYSELWKSSLRGGAGLCKANCGVCCKAELALGQPSGRLIKPQVIHQAGAVPAAPRSLYYFNYLDAAYHPADILHGQLFPAGLLGAPPPGGLSAHQKLFLLENAKLAGLAAEKLPPPPPFAHKERLPGHLDQVMKEAAVAAERGGPPQGPRQAGGRRWRRGGGGQAQKLHLRGLRQGVQRALQPHPPYAGAHGGQAVRVQGLREGLPPGQHPVPAQNHPHPGETPQVQPVREGVQQELHAQHPHPHPRRLQALRLRVLRQGLPPERQLQEPQADPQRREAVQVHHLQQSLPPDL